MSNTPDLLLPKRYDAEQVGKVTPQLYIGLGGQGGRMVKRLHERMNSLATWKKYQESSTGFLVLDTDVEDLKAYPKTGKIKTVCTKPEGLRAEIDRKLAQKDPFLLSWLPEGYQPRTSNKGAGQIRIESRVAFIMNSPVIARAIDAIIDEVLDFANPYRNTETKEVQIHVFATLAGGTGSGCFLPLAYLLRERLSARSYKPTMQGHLLTSHTVHGKVGREIHVQVDANAYAGLKELEFLNRQATGAEPVPFVYRLGASLSEKLTTVDVPPFDWVSIYDKPARMNLGADEIAKACSDAAYLNISTPAQQANSSQRDNYTKFMLTTQTPTNAGPVVAGDAGYTAYYGATGAAALICPRQELLEYCILRFTAHTLRQQLTLPGAKQAEASAIEAISSDRAVQQLILENQWRARFEELSTDEYKGLEARIQQFERLGMSHKDADEAARAEMFYARRFHAVNGRWPGLEGPTGGPKKQTLGFGGKSDASKESADVSLVDRLRAQLDTDLSALDTNIAKSKQFNVQMLESGQLVGELNGARSAADRKWRELQGYKDLLLRNARESFSTLREKSDQKTPFDAIAERYLVGLLLKEHIDGWLNEARAEADALSKRTLVGNTSTPQSVQELAEKIKERRIDTVRKRVAELLPSVDYDADMLGYAQEANDMVSGIITTTNKWAKASMRVLQLEELKKELSSRANTFATLTRRALDRADALDAKAAERRVADLEDDKNYQLRVEVLAGPQGPMARMWNWFWEDFGADEAAKLMNNAKWVGEVTTGVLEEEERRVAADPAGAAQADPTRILDQLEQKLGEPARTAMIDFVREQTELDDLLQLDAAYMSIDPNSEDSRKAQVRHMRAAANDPQHGDHAEVVARLSSHVAAKLRLLKGRAELLAHVDVNAVDQLTNPFQQGRYLVADAKMIETLDTRYPSAVDQINTGKQNAANRPYQEWHDPRSMMLVEVYAAVPIYAFPNVIGLHGNYVHLNPHHKANPLHIQANWEDPDALLDLEQASRARQAPLFAMRQNRGWLAQLAVGGILRLRGKGDAAHAVLAIGQGDLPRAEDGFGPLTLGSEAELVAFWRGVSLLLGNEGYRNQLTRSLDPTVRKPGLAGALVRWMQKAIGRGEYENWSSRGELRELQALASAIASALEQ